jgi:phosphoribosylaminoimidazole-succinocarboxamide synthase
VQAGRGAKAYGLELDPALRRDQELPRPIITPSTKEAVGQHDQPISPAEVVARAIVSQRGWDELAERALALFERGREWAKGRGLILVDTKYEFGVDERGSLWLIDEIHTADSSRYWLAEGSDERLARGEEQRMLDKEFIRQWLIQERRWQGDGPLPDVPDEIRVELASRYAALVQRLTGEAPALRVGDTRARIEGSLRAKAYL